MDALGLWLLLFLSWSIIRAIWVCWRDPDWRLIRSGDINIGVDDENR